MKISHKIEKIVVYNKTVRNFPTWKSPADNVHCGLFINPIDREHSNYRSVLLELYLLWW